MVTRTCDQSTESQSSVRTLTVYDSYIYNSSVIVTCETLPSVTVWLIWVSREQCLVTNFTNCVILVCDLLPWLCNAYHKQDNILRVGLQCQPLKRNLDEHIKQPVKEKQGNISSIMLDVVLLRLCGQWPLTSCYANTVHLWDRTLILSVICYYTSHHNVIVSQHWPMYINTSSDCYHTMYWASTLFSNYLIIS